MKTYLLTFISCIVLFVSTIFISNSNLLTYFHSFTPLILYNLYMKKIPQTLLIQVFSKLCNNGLPVNAILELHTYSMRQWQIVMVLKVPSQTVPDAGKGSTSLGIIGTEKKEEAKTKSKRKMPVKRFGRIPKVSERKVTNGMTINRETVRQIMKQFLGYKPYKLKQFQKFTAAPKKARVPKWICSNEACRS